MTRTRYTQRVDDEDLGTLVVCAVRYAIGRQTYMPSTMSEIVRRLTLSQDTRNVLVRTIDAEERARRLGPECDAMVWRSLRDWLRGKGPSAGRGGET